MRNLLLASVLGVALAVAGCAGEVDRSVEAFCDTYAAEERTFIERRNERAQAIADQQDPLAAFGEASAAIYASQGDMIVFLDKLSRSSPDDIRPDVDLLLDALRESAGTVETDLLQAAVAGFVLSSRVDGANQRVDDFVAENCWRERGVLPDQDP